jgi:protein-tyrosine phosphatase
MTETRLLALDGAVNFRDLGGYQNRQGQKIKWQKIYRSDSLSSLSANDQAKLSKLQITVDCDLRSAYERSISPDQLWSGAKYLALPLYAETERKQDQLQIQRWLRRIPLSHDYLGSIYQQIVLSPHSQAIFRQIFQELLKLPAKQALLYHCSAGKDRTGITSALILMALGIDDQTIVQDYLLTNQLYDFAWKKQLPSKTELAQMVARMNTTKGDALAIRAVMETIRAGWGSFHDFFQQVLHFSKQDLLDLRQLYLE